MADDNDYHDNNSSSPHTNPLKNPWPDMDEGSSPWDDVPSRSHSNHNLPKAAAQEEENQSPSVPSPPSEQTKPASSPSPVSGAKPAPVKSRPNRRHGNLTQSTVLESIDDSMGPLGPLGMEPTEEPPAPTPPTKELASRPRQSQGGRPSTGDSSIHSNDLEDDASSPSNGARVPPPVQPPQFDNRMRQPHPSMSVEQASKPTFNITVGDPHTVGNATNSHTVYSVITKTTSKAYLNPSFTVTRRYRDFLWLYNQLHTNNPGVVVPPPPEKQAVGRFNTEFVESRRMALERQINKIAAHPVLQHDGDLKTFLESEAFNVDIKHKDRKDPLLGAGESKGLMSSIGLGGGGGGGKFIEHDDWFHDRKIYLDALENQLKALQKSADTVVGQRKALAESCGEFSNSLHNLAAVELSASLSGPLDSLGDLQERIQELYQRQAMQDVLTLGIVIDEYIRLIGSVKKAFEQRQKAYHSWHSAESKLQEVKKQQEKLLRAGRTQQERIGQMQADVADAERKVNASRLLFEDMGRLMRQELERFEKEKVEDFKSGVETFLETAVEAQKQLIELWETFLLELDADEENGSNVPFGLKADDAAHTTNDDEEPATGSLSGTTAGDSEETAPVTAVTAADDDVDAAMASAAAAAASGRDGEAAGLGIAGNRDDDAYFQSPSTSASQLRAGYHAAGPASSPALLAAPRVVHKLQRSVDLFDARRWGE